MWFKLRCSTYDVENLKNLKASNLCLRIIILQFSFVLFNPWFLTLLKHNIFTSYKIEKIKTDY